MTENDEELKKALLTEHGYNIYNINPLLISLVLQIIIL